MEMTVRQEERCLEIALIGELDHHAAREIGGRLDRAIEAALPLRLVLDWSGVTLWTAPVSRWSCGSGSACGTWAAP